MFHQKILEDLIFPSFLIYLFLPIIGKHKHTVVPSGDSQKGWEWRDQTRFTWMICVEVRIVIILPKKVYFTTVFLGERTSCAMLSKHLSPSQNTVERYCSFPTSENIKTYHHYILSSSLWIWGVRFHHFDHLHESILNKRNREIMFNKSRNTVLNMFKQVFALINKTTGYFFQSLTHKYLLKNLYSAQGKLQLDPLKNLNLF